MIVQVRTSRDLLDTLRIGLSYHELEYEEATRAEPAYAPLDGKWPAPSRDEALILYEAIE